jgi:hypothetical protein
LAKDLTPKQRYDLARAMADEEGGEDDPA